MAKQTGTAGEVSFDSATLHITQFTRELTDDILDATDSGSAGWREKVAKGIKNWTVSVQGHFDSADTLPTAGDSATILMTYAAGDTETGTALVASSPRAVDVPGTTLNTVSIEFEGSGALT